MSRRIVVTLSDRHLDQLVKWAQREKRHPRQQAAWLLEQALDAMGLHDALTEMPQRLSVGGPVVPPEWKGD